ncbi:MAG: alpha-1,2-fucosyltransferase [Synergistaceae bacterium]|jgi:hypothetical protein|nr:alpha-1,2-fucosyltransferase [Synergistaceae bacterium]
MSCSLLTGPYKALIAPVVRGLIAAGRNFRPSVVVKMDGGLGSQMWQYAIGRGAGRASGLRALYDLSWFDGDTRDINGIYSRAYQLEPVFPCIKPAKADQALLLTYRLHFDLYPGTRLDYDETIFSSRSPRYLGGYYVNAKYVDGQGDGLRDEFKFNVPLTTENGLALSRIKTERHSTAIHIRRGDYVGSAHDVTTPDYFRGAVKWIADRLPPGEVVFFVFSNGIDWSREILRDLDYEFIYIDDNDNDNGHIDMYLMSQCSHFIISNSSFSWWPAWLSRRSADKIVVMPDKWKANELRENRLSMRAEGWDVVPVR